MRSPLRLCATQSIVLQPPRLWRSVSAAAVGLAFAAGLGAMATCALTGLFPAWFGPALNGTFSRIAMRALLFLLGFAGGVAGLLVMLGYAGRAWNLFKLRLGVQPVWESEGPCDLVEEPPGLWELRMDLTSGDRPRLPAPPTRHVPRGSGGYLLFRIDEACAGTVSRLFQPGERLRVRWVEASAATGGSILLEIASREVAEQSERAAHGDEDLMAA